MHSFIIIQSSRVRIVPQRPEMLYIHNSVSSWSQWPSLVVTTEREEVSPGLERRGCWPGLEINRAVDTVARSPGTQYNPDTPQSSASCLQSLELETHLRKDHISIQFCIVSYSRFFNVRCSVSSRFQPRVCTTLRMFVSLSSLLGSHNTSCPARVAGAGDLTFL